MTFDPKGNLYVVSFDNTVIIKLSPDGTASTVAVLPGVGNGHIAFYDDFLYVTQFLQNRIYRVSQEGDFELIAGSGEPENVDGVGTNAKLAWPNGIAVAGGTLYINTIEGAWRDSAKQGQVLVRVIKLPTLFRTLEAGLDSKNESDLRRMLDEYLAEYKANIPIESLLAGLDYASTRLIAKSKHKHALRVAELSATLGPESPTPLITLGDVYYQVDELEVAKKFYLQALKLKPGDAYIQSRLDALAG